MFSCVFSLTILFFYKAPSDTFYPFTRMACPENSAKRYSIVLIKNNFNRKGVVDVNDDFRKVLNRAGAQLKRFQNFGHIS
ncbi:MAG: hypothetical protein CVT92_11765 [Bacteroidetes bacterium HGW-Bacteroidetes-1]|nr:MAG: hypothetical protein CVT92_11765 [Bacteroidetes bacterium HGW-Bacteroidetes-1]